MRVAGELHLEMARPLDQPFDQHAVVAEGALRLAPGQRRAAPAKSARSSTRRMPLPPPPALALMSSGTPIARASSSSSARLLRVAVIARHAGHAGVRGDALGFDLRAHALDHVGARADPGDAVLRAAAHQLGALGEKAVAGMDRARARWRAPPRRSPRRRDSCAPPRRADAHGGVGLAHMARRRVGVGVDGDRAQCRAGVHVRMIRQAISPRLAIRSDSNIARPYIRNTGDGRWPAARRRRAPGTGRSPRASPTARSVRRPTGARWRSRDRSAR